MKIRDLLSRGKSSSKSYDTKRYDLKEGILRSKLAINELLTNQDRPQIIQIAGGSSSGKTTQVTQMLAEHYLKAARISMDDYYYGKAYMEKEAKKGRDLNWDQPEAINIPKLQDHIELLKSGVPIKKPIYSMKESETCGTEDIYPNEIILLEGLFTLTDGLHEKGDLNIFCSANEATRLKRRIERDQQRTGQTPEQIIEYFREAVEPMHQKYIEGTSRNAHIIIENNMKIGKILN